LLLDFLPLSDKSVYLRVRIGDGRTNLRFLPCAEMGSRAREAFEAHWDKEQALARWEAVLTAQKTK
jgi:hypothetical protein